MKSQSEYIIPEFLKCEQFPLQVGLTSDNIKDIISISQDSPDIILRKLALKKCTWMNFGVRSQIQITEKGIKIGKITIALHDEPKEMDFYTAKKIVPNHIDWYIIMKIIGGDEKQQLYFFRQVLQMKDSSYWSSSDVTSTYGYSIEFKEDTIRINSWCEKEKPLSVRSL